MIELVGTLILLLAPSAASNAARAEPVAATRVAEDAREARRILFLASGQTIRVLSRQRDGAWEYRGRSGWERLDPRAVTKSLLEADALRSWREERGRAAPKDLDARARLARFAAEHGLATEALAELDLVLAQDPDHEASLAVLRECWLLSVPPIESPGGDEGPARAELLRFGASLPAAAREVVVRELARSRDAEALRAQLAGELWSSVVARRSFAALALRRIFPGAEPKALLVHAVRDASLDVRRESARALRSANDPALMTPLVRALGSASVSIRSNAASALGEMGYPAAVEPLVARMAAAMQASSDARAPHSHVFFGGQTAYLQDFDVEVAQFQAVADPNVNVLLTGDVLDAAVIGAREEAVTIELVAIRGALEELTGANPGHTARAWLAWWEKEGARWRAADRALPATRADRGAPVKE